MDRKIESLWPRWFEKVFSRRRYSGKVENKLDQSEHWVIRIGIICGRRRHRGNSVVDCDIERLRHGPSNDMRSRGVREL